MLEKPKRGKTKGVSAKTPMLNKPRCAIFWEHKAKTHVKQTKK